MSFTSKFGNEQESFGDLIYDSDDEQAKSTNNIFTKIQKALKDDLSAKDTEELTKDIERMLKMFYLDMRVKGKLN
jgi:hypothetical protein